MSITQDVVDDYIATIAAAFPEFDVSEMPDLPSAYALRHPRGEILVQYSNSDFAAPAESSSNYQGAALRDVPQRRRMNVQLTLVLRSLRGPNGTTQTVDAVRQSLKKFRPRHCLTQVYFVSDGFISEKQGVWQYGINTAVELWEK